jgi:4-amino-4-deoxy-L-arabinose transferase-like glycosyltransferase
VSQGNLKRRVGAVIAVAAIAALQFVVLFWRLGEPTFWNPDEAHYAETTRELITTGDWWAPAYNEQPFFDKPILFHQLQAVAMLMHGQNELGARAVPAIAALALVAITAWFGTALVSPEVGLLGALLVAVNPGLFGLARYAILDTLFTAFLFGGAALVSTAAIRGRPRLQYPGYVLIALATLTKGPLAIVLCGLAMLLAIAASPTLRRQLLALRWVVGLTMVLVLASPWFIYMYMRFGQSFIDGYLLDENVLLFAASKYARQPGPWFYIQILAAGMLPWTAIVVGRLIDDIRAVIARRKIDDREVLLWAWTAAIILFFTPSRFKLDHYVFPALPALALLCARAWADVRADLNAAEHRGARIGVMLVGPLLVLLGVVAGYLVVARLDLPRYALMAPAGMVVAGVTMIVRLWLRRRPAAQFPVPALAALALTYAVVVSAVMPALETRKVMPHLARWIAARATKTDRVASYHLHNAFRFYVNHHVTVLQGPEELLRFIEGEEPFFCVMPESVYQSVAKRATGVEAVYWRDGVATTSGRALWRGPVQWTRFVVVTRARRAKG